MPAMPQNPFTLISHHAYDAANRFNGRKMISMQAGPESGKIVFWDETWHAWHKAMPKHVRRHCRTTQKMSCVFAHLAKNVRWGRMPVYYTPTWLAFPTSKDAFYGPLGRYLRASDILKAFDTVHPNDQSEIRQALVKTLEEVPHHASAPTHNGRLLFACLAPTPSYGDLHD